MKCVHDRTQETDSRSGRSPCPGLATGLARQGRIAIPNQPAWFAPRPITCVVPGSLRRERPWRFDRRRTAGPIMPRVMHHRWPGTPIIVSRLSNGSHVPGEFRCEGTEPMPHSSRVDMIRRRKKNERPRWGAAHAISRIRRRFRSRGEAEARILEPEEAWGYPEADRLSGWTGRLWGHRPEPRCR